MAFVAPFDRLTNVTEKVVSTVESDPSTVGTAPDFCFQMSCFILSDQGFVSFRSLTKEIILTEPTGIIPDSGNKIVLTTGDDEYRLLSFCSYHCIDFSHHAQVECKCFIGRIFG